MTTESRTVTDNLEELLAVLPGDLAERIAPDERAALIEIVLDLGRRPEARFIDRFAYLREEVVTREELDFVETQLGAFGGDNRAGIPATLHRISAMRNRRGEVVGLTLRVGRAVMGIVDILRDLIESGQSLLLMGRPGLGKTTLLREIARVLADELGKRVVIVDTSNEIAGDGDVPHPAIGRARRMQVAQVSQQHDVMIEAVENHMPEVVVIDEIGRVEETLAARTIAERGVQLVATVHGNTLDNLLANPTMSDLIGGIQAVTLSDEEARRRRTQKTVLERKAPPTFDVVVEMIERDHIAVRRPVDEVVDALLRGYEAPPEIRRRDENGNVQIERAPADHANSEHDFEMRGATAGRAAYNGGGRGDRRGSAERSNAERGNGRGGSSRGHGLRDFSSPLPGGRFGARSERGERSTDRSDASARAGRRDRAAYKSPFEMEDALPREDRRAGGEFASGEDAGSIAGGGRNIPRGDMKPRDAYEQALLDRATDAGPLNVSRAAPGISNGALEARDPEQESERDDPGTQNSFDDFDEPAFDEADAAAPRLRPDAPVDVSRVRRLYPFGVSRSRLGRAIKHLGLPVAVARTWREADAVMMLTGAEGVPLDSSLLRAPREMGLPIIAVGSNTYADVLARLNDLYSAQIGEGHLSPRDLAMREAQTAAQRVLAEAEPVELRPQGKPLRRVQHQLAEKFHLRSYSVGREPNRRVRYLPRLAR